MVVTDGGSARELRRLQTRERLLGAAISEFKRTGMAEADVRAIVAAAGVAHGTFFFHFPTKEHVLLELENREEERLAAQFSRFLSTDHDLAAALREAIRLGLGLEQLLGEILFKDLLALHFSQTHTAVDMAPSRHSGCSLSPNEPAVGAAPTPCVPARNSRELPKHSIAQ